MPRKRVDLERTGVKPNHQKIWEPMRLLKKFSWWDISKKTDLAFDVVIPYVKLLAKAGVIQPIANEKVANYLPRAPYTMFRVVQDLGREAPRITKDGRIRTDVPITQQMWNVIRMQRRVDCHDLVGMATCTVSTARSYLKALNYAGYLDVAEPMKGSHSKRTSHVYWLHAHMNTGPRAPMVMRVKTVYDQNRGEVVWRQPEQELIDEKL